MNNTIFDYKNILGWLFGAIILIIGLLNLFLVHPVPGIIYIVFSFIFFPPVNFFIQKKFGFSIPFLVKLILFLLIIWGTLAVGDLAEMYGL